MIVGGWVGKGDDGNTRCLLDRVISPREPIEEESGRGCPTPIPIVFVSIRWKVWQPQSPAKGAQGGKAVVLF